MKALGRSLILLSFTVFHWIIEDLGIPRYSTSMTKFYSADVALLNANTVTRKQSSVECSSTYLSRVEQAAYKLRDTRMSHVGTDVR